VPSWHRAFAEASYVSNVSFRECKRGKVEARWMTALGRFVWSDIKSGLRMKPTLMLAGPDQRTALTALELRLRTLGQQPA